MTRSKSAKPEVFSGFRRKFIATTMLFAVAVFAVMACIVAGVNYQQRESEVYSALERQVGMTERFEGQGKTPPAGMPEGMLNMPEPPQQALPTEGDDTDLQLLDTPSGDAAKSSEDAGIVLSFDKAQRFERRESSDDQFIATSSYIIRAEGTAFALEDPLGLDDDTLAQALAAASSNLSDECTSARGHISGLNLYYVAQAAADGTTHAAFASGNYVDSNMKSLLLTFAAVSPFVLLAFLGISWLLARWAVRPVEQAWAQQQQFIADASHELKTPLTVIIANDAILSANPQATVAEQMQWIESTETEAKLMQGLVNDMLYLAQMEGTRAPEQVRETVNLSDVVENVSLTFDSVAFERGIMVEDDVEQNVQVEGDSTRLTRLAATLVDNACKYAEEGSTVTVRLARAGQVARLSVHNTGKPIDAQDLPHLFDRFYRADKARTSGKGGYGLGLAIAKSIAEDHGGSISATSSEEEGTTFTVEVPLLKASK